MANYNVGNIEIGAVVNDQTAIAKLDSLISKVEQVKNVQTKNVTQQNAFNKSLSKSSTLASQLKNSFNLGKLYFLINYSKRFIQFATKMVTIASDYVEVLNKFQVSFGELTEENLEFVDKITKAYGFSRNTIMDYQSTFNNMLKSLDGLTDEMSAKLSRTLTQMAIDYSSLFNQSIESTMLAFQSMLSGSIRPIRSVSGFDVSETSIFAVYQELGGTKTMRQLTQLEKRLLRIIAVQQQMQEVGATGDFYRTRETFSNQVKILTEQVKELGTIWGRIFLVKLKPVIRFLNGFLMAMNEIGEVMTKNIQLTEDIDFNKEFASFDKIGDDIDGVTESVDKLNGSLSTLGLDRLNVLGGKSVASSMLEIDPKIMNGLQEYMADLDNVNMKAKDIAKNILSWLGFEYNVNGELEKTNNTLDGILIATGGIVGGLSIAKIFPHIKKLITALAGVGEVLVGIIGSISGTAFAIIGAIVAIGVALADLFTNGSQDSQNWFKKLAETWELTLKPALNNFMNIVSQIKEIFGYLYDNIVIPIASIVGDLLVNTIIPALSSIFTLVTSILGFITPILKLIVGFISPIIELALGGLKLVLLGISEVISWFVDSVNFMGKLIIDIANLVIEGINWLIRALNNFNFKLPDWLGGWEVGFNLKEIPKLELPQFANGTVATQPTLGMFGEYANAKSNPEIVSPQSLMAETFLEAVVPMVNAITKGNHEVATILKNQKLSLNVNGRQLAESTISDYSSVADRQGQTIKFNK